MKRKYSTIQNIIFTHNYILQGIQFLYWLTAILIILGTIAATFMLTYLPAYAVELLTNPGDLQDVLLPVAIYSVLLCMITVIYKRIKRNIDKAIINRRMLKGQDYYVEIIKTEYENIDSSKYKALFHAGSNSFFDGIHEGLHHIIFDLRTFLSSIIGLAVYVVCIARVNILISLFLLLVSAFSVIANVYNERWVSKNQNQWFALDTKIKYLSKESIALKNAKDVRLFPIKDWFIDTLGCLTQLRQNWYKKALRLLYLINITERFLTAAKYLAAYFIVFESVKNGLEVSQFILFIGLILGMNQWVTSIFESVKYLQLNSIHVENTRMVLDMGAFCKEESKISSTLPHTIPEIKLEDVSFTFPESETQILDHFNLTIAAGEKLAIVGNNGAGKSTLIKLICGLYQPTSGRILLNGLDTRNFKREDIYEYFSVVFQDLNLLAVSIAENVSCCPKEKTDVSRVFECIEKAGLSEKITSLPEGLDSNLLKELDANGVILSGGEKQKLMISRCLYKDSPVMILDEPTSALDAIAESEIYDKYNSLAKDKTSIFISHRLSSTKFCDRIILLDKGKVLEEGTHDELQKQNGQYADMYAIQSSYYQKEVSCG